MCPRKRLPKPPPRVPASLLVFFQHICHLPGPFRVQSMRLLPGFKAPSSSTGLHSFSRVCTAHTHLSSTRHPPVPIFSTPFSLSPVMKPLTICSLKPPLLCASVFSHTLFPLKFFHSSHIYTLFLVISPHIIAPSPPAPYAHKLDH